MIDSERIFYDFRETFDFNRIRALAVPERFKLVNLCSLIYSEALFAEKNGVDKLSLSPNYNFNRTYRLYAMLVSEGVHYDFLKRMAKNYCRNFDKSDIYYSHTAVTAMGIIMIAQKLPPKAIHNFLIHILGREFLIENAKFSGMPPKEFNIDPSSLPEIEYEPYEGDMRRLKYELLALLKYSKENGLEKTSKIINYGFKKDNINFYFNMLNVEGRTTTSHIYNTYEIGTPSRTERLKLNGCMAILSGADIYTIHYLLNSIVGKYTALESIRGEVESEVDVIISTKLKEMEKNI